MTVSVVVGCVPASETGIALLLLEMENVAVCTQGPGCLPVFALVRCHWAQLFTLQLNWPNGGAKGR